MGVAHQGVFGPFQNRVGNIVGRILQGRQVYSIYQPSVANPDTPAQRQYRTLFRAASALGSALIEPIRIGFRKKDGYDYGSAYSSFVGFNLKKGDAFAIKVDGTAGINYDRLVVSEGTLAPLSNAQCGLDGSDITATWSFVEGAQNPTDKVYLVAYNAVRNLAVMSNGTDIRSDRAAALSLPPIWTGGSVEVYLFATDERTGNCTLSFYGGNFAV